MLLSRLTAFHHRFSFLTANDAVEVLVHGSIDSCLFVKLVNEMIMSLVPGSGSTDNGNRASTNRAVLNKYRMRYPQTWTVKPEQSMLRRLNKGFSL